MLECPALHVNFGGSCYFPSFLDENSVEDKPWNEAREYCQKILPRNEWRYDLISIQTKEELDFMLHFDWSENYKGLKEESSIWIGLNNLEDMSNWQWSDESEVIYPTEDTLEIRALPWMKKQTDYDQTVRWFYSCAYAQLFLTILNPNFINQLDKYYISKKERCAATSGLSGIYAESCNSAKKKFICKGTRVGKG